MDFIFIYGITRGIIMLYVHEDNLLNKINSDYNGLKEELKKFYKEEYISYKDKLNSLNFASEDMNIFEEASRLINEYLIKLYKAQNDYNIDPRSKFRSSFLEEISTYLFKDLSLITDETFVIHNKKIYAGMKVNNQMHIDILSKDVDFCIGKKVILKVEYTKESDNIQEIPIIVPVICVEVKTYLDATMFGEAQFSSKQIKNASPNVKTYVLMEYNEVKKEKIIAARYDNNLNEMFVLRSGSKKNDDSLNPRPLDSKALLEYYKEISTTIENTDVEDIVNNTGKLLGR